MQSDINAFTPFFAFLPSNLGFGEFFLNCSMISGTVDPSVYWENVQFVGKNLHETSQCFAGCSDELRAQIPVSWGGTAQDAVVGMPIGD